MVSRFVLFIGAETFVGFKYSKVTTLGLWLTAFQPQWFFAYAAIVSSVLFYSLDTTIVSQAYSSLLGPQARFSTSAGRRHPAVHHRDARRD